MELLLTMVPALLAGADAEDVVEAAKAVVARAAVDAEPTRMPLLPLMARLLPMARPKRPRKAKRPATRILKMSSSKEVKRKRKLRIRTTSLSRSTCRA